MSMPEASVHEDDDAMPWQHEVWPSRKIAAVKPEAESKRMDEAADGEFRARVARSNPGHHPAAAFGIDDISHRPMIADSVDQVMAPLCVSRAVVAFVGNARVRVIEMIATRRSASSGEREIRRPRSRNSGGHDEMNWNNA